MFIKNYLTKSLLVMLCLVLVGIAGQAANQNETTFQDPDGKYELQLPPSWKAVNYQDGAGKPRIDIIYRDRVYGLLQVRQENVNDVTDIKSQIQLEIDQNLRFRPGFVFNSTERFTGQYTRGELLQFDFTSGGTPKKGRNYYLRTNNSLWVLRFTGNRDVLSPLRHETDAIARSFKPLK